MAADGDEDETWLLALEAVLPDCSDEEEIISVTRGRILPEEHRAQIWHLCLGGATKMSTFGTFDQIFDLQEQNVIREDCRALVDKLGNEEDDKVSVLCDVESVFTHYCKVRNISYSSSSNWPDLLLPLLGARMPADSAFLCFQELRERYVPRDTEVAAPVYHLLRLLLLYHDPELANFLDSRRIAPDMFATTWVRSLFAAVCPLDSVLAVWDVYLQEKDPFFVLFLSIVILINARDQILAMNTDTKASIVSSLALIPSSLRVQDVQDFCSLARFYVHRTPTTYRKDFEREIFGSVYLGEKKKRRKKRKKKKKEEQQEEEEEERELGNLPLSQALCLSVSAQEILELSHSLSTDDTDQVRFFLVDCRPSEEYNSGHLPTAFHLDASLMLQQPTQFLTAVQGLLLAQKNAITEQGLAGHHLCFIGRGGAGQEEEEEGEEEEEEEEEEEGVIYMVVSFFLQRFTPFVSLAKGGYRALHKELSRGQDQDQDLNTCLTDHNKLSCLVCSPRPPQEASAPLHAPPLAPQTPALKNRDPQPEIERAGLTGRFSSLSLALKSRSAEVKDKLVEYITNPAAENTTTTTTTAAAATGTTATRARRHISSADKGKLYRNLSDVFSIEDEEDEGQYGAASELERDREMALERVDIRERLKRGDVLAHFPCHQVKENGYLHKSTLILTHTSLLVIRDGDGSNPPATTTTTTTTTTATIGLLVACHSLNSILKITSKKKHPELITFKYGIVHDDDSAATTTTATTAAATTTTTTAADTGSIEVVDMDRFLIPGASKATKLIKEQILKQMESVK